MEGGEHPGMGGGLGFCHAIFSPTAARTAGGLDACELARRLPARARGADQQSA